jgi:hypothetical protein
MLNADKVGVDPTAILDTPVVDKMCAVAAPSTTLNCTGVQAKVDGWSVAVDTKTQSGSNFKACCNCLYGQSTINVFTVTAGSHTASRAAQPPLSAPKANTLALSEAEYNKNYVILVSIVAPLAVVLVASLAGNVLLVLKLRQGSARRGDAEEMSHAPRGRVDV